MYNIFVTGHTSGIGKAIYDHLDSQGYHVEGGSRSNNWDITKDTTANYIKDKFDVLINNAYHSDGQVKLLKNVYNGWQKKKKTIINIGSWHKDHLSGRPFSSLNYNVDKKALETYSFWIAANDDTCRSMMYNVGFVDTPTSRKHMAGWSEEKQKEVLTRCMDPKVIARTIQFMIENEYNIKELTHHA